VIACNIFLITKYGIITLRDPQATLNDRYIRTIIQTAEWFKERYDNRSLLIEGFGNEGFEFLSRMPLGHVIYEGSYRLWEKALADPAQYADWIIMRALPSFGDKVYRRWHDTPYLKEHYKLVYTSFLIEIYERQTPLDHDPIARATSGA
jgi:hypothetical protein